MQLTTDPFTGNRYTFGAGNPISNIELDGHTQCDAGYCPTQQQTAQVTHTALTAYNNDVAWYQKQEAAAENQAVSGCGSGPCMMNIYRNFQNPVYAARQIQQYQISQQIQAANQRAYLEQQAEAASGCGFLGLSCAARWVGHEVAAHWRGLLQIGVFVACLGSGMALCGAAMAVSVFANFVADVVETGDWGAAFIQAGESAAIDLASLGVMRGVTKALDSVIEATSGLTSAAKGAVKGRAGRFFGAYSGYAPRHAAGFVARHAAPMFANHPIPVIGQIIQRAEVNELSCTGTGLAYCP
jgi:hypothetical protein